MEATGYRLGDHIEFKLSTRITDDETMDVRIPLPDLATKKPDVLVTQLEGPIRRLDTLRDQALAEAERCTQRASDAAARIGQPFPDQKRLTDLRRRYREILDALNPAPEEPPVATSEATPSTTAQAARLDALRDPQPPGGSGLSI